MLEYIIFRLNPSVPPSSSLMATLPRREDSFTSPSNKRFMLIDVSSPAHLQKKLTFSSIISNNMSVNKSGAQCQSGYKKNMLQERFANLTKLAY